MPRTEILANRKENSGRGTFDRGDLKEVADSTRYGATIDSLCNEELAGGLKALREGTSALQWAATPPEDITPAVAVAVGHFVQVVIWEVRAVLSAFSASQRWGTTGRGLSSGPLRVLPRAALLPVTL